jgi:glycosyltransferase involved in cell wall biosynthesis
MRHVLHVLPHPGGGAENYIDILEGLPGYSHERVVISGSRSRLRGAVTLAMNRRRIGARSRAADLVHVHGDTAAMLSVPILRRGPSLITSHGLHRIRRSAGVGPGARAMVRAMRAASIVICTSSAERDDLTDIAPPALHDRLVVVPNGVPLPAATSAPARARARAALGVDDDRLVGLFLGRLEARKEPLLAVEAAQRAAAGGTDLVLLVAGDGPLSAALSKRASNAVRPLGFRRDPGTLYAAADVFVLPSRREGMSIALLTAMSHGLAVVVTDAAGSAETVGQAGLVVAPEAAAFAGALAKLAADAGERRRLGEAARRRIAEDLSAERFLERTASAYERALQVG